MALPCVATESDSNPVYLVSAGTVTLDTLVVSSGLVDGPATPSTASLVTRIDLDERSGFGDLNDVLSTVAGLQMARLGGWGASAVPSLRGSSAAQIRFFLDGVPLPDAQTGLAGFNQISLDRLQAVEVHRGTVPVGLGGLGGVGAVNFITRKNDEGLDVSAQLGSFGERGIRVSTGGAVANGSRGGMLAVHGHRADNDFRYLDHNQTFYRGDDDTVRVRENAWVEERGAWANGYWLPGALELRGSLGYSRRDGGRPGPLGYLSTVATVRYDRLSGQGHLDWAAGLLKVDFAVGQNDEYLFDPAGEVGYTPAGTTHSVSNDIYTRLAWSPTLVTGFLDFSTGLSWGRERQTETLVGVIDPERRREIFAAFAALTADLIDGRLQVVPAWRWQQTDDNFPMVPGLPSIREATGVTNSRDDISPSLGIVWTVKPDHFYAELHAARTVRIPSWIELFGHRGGVIGNRELLPEEITSVDFALSLRNAGRVSGRAAVFYAGTDDKIIFIQASQRASKADNLGRTEARGLELEGAVVLPADWRLSGNITVQKIEDRSEGVFSYGNDLPFLPEREAHLRLSGRVGRWRPWLESAHMSRHFRDRANTELDEAPARSRLNFGLSRDWYPIWLGPAGVISVAAEVINLTDNDVYDVEGFPLPGRSWHISVRLRR